VDVGDLTRAQKVKKKNLGMKIIAQVFFDFAFALVAWSQSQESLHCEFYHLGGFSVNQKEQEQYHE
jgi:hypothetical protein